jgi:MoaE-MoaD fusion protein
VNVRIRLFAMLRERAGAESIELSLDDHATVADALRELRAREPLADVLAGLPVVMAVNRDYADPATRLRADDELALIPPVSGGAPVSADAHVRVGEDPLSLDALSRAVSRPGAGAIVIFCGVTREVPRLHYEAYREMAVEKMRLIVSECMRRYGLHAAAAEHRVGEVALGEASVIVAASAPHRPEAFAAARELIDRIKAEAPIWKREAAADGSLGWVQGTLSHIDSQGRAGMVDVGTKEPGERKARARARVRMSPRSAAAIEAGNAPKGDVLSTARLAGIQAAKQTGYLIPLAHPIELTFVDVSAALEPQRGLVELIAEAHAIARTGVEMEAMTACAVASLTIYDMVKGIERGVEIEQVVLLEKTGGRAAWRREDGHAEGHSARAARAAHDLAAEAGA